MTNAWMIRSMGGYYADKFAKGFVAIGWERIGDLAKATDTDAIRNKFQAAYPQYKKGAVAGAVATLRKFRHEIEVGDWVITYDPSKREYLIGKVASDYFFDPKQISEEFPHVRKVTWEHRISRDALSPASKNTLGSTLTLFSVGNEVFADLLDAAKRPNKTPPIREEDADKAEQERIKDELVEKAHELIKDKILELTDEELPQLVATILQAMGFKARISPKGPDRGVDVFASPDGLGFQEPRIKVEVKHRPNDQIQAPQLRSFLGGLRAGDKGLYVSSGGFTKEAKYEADRSNVPVMLVDLDELARLIVDHYPRFDSNGQALLPLVRIYWPSE